MKTIDRIIFVIGLVLLFGGLDLTILLSHNNRLVGVLLIIIGLALILGAAKSSEPEVPKKMKKPENLASKIIFAVGLVLLFGGLNLIILFSYINIFVGIGLIFAGLRLILGAAKSSESEISEKIIFVGQALIFGGLNLIILFNHINIFVGIGLIFAGLGLGLILWAAKSSESKISEKIIFVIGQALIFGGLNLIILFSHINIFVGIGLIFAGLGLILWAAKSSESAIPEKIKKPENLASKIIHILTLNGRFRESIPIAGIGVFVSVFTFNLIWANEFRLGSNDYVGLMLAGMLILYDQIPKKYSVEKDFALLFSIFLFVFLVIPTTLLQLTSDGGTVDTNSPLTYYFLAMPTAALSNLLGIPVVSPFTDPITLLPVYHIMQVPGPDGYPLNLSISLSCSGLYSVAIFVSAFIAFVSVEYKKFDLKVGVLLGMGIVLAWIANIIRMTIIVIVGHYYGMDTMVWTHNNIGELIFMAWVILFWLFMFKYFGVLDSKESTPRKEPKGKCAICGEILSPSMQSKRCECGAISHTVCILTNEHRCPSCGVEFEQ